MTSEAIWDTPKELVKLAKVDGSEKDLKKTIKRFLNECFEPTTYAHLLAETIEDHKDEEDLFLTAQVASACVVFLEKFHKAMGKLEKKGFGLFAQYALDLYYEHSKVKEIMLDPSYKDTHIRSVVIKLFCQLCEKRIDDCIENKDNFVDHLLSSYHASLTTDDQLLLRLLSRIELAGHNLERHRPFIWGANGAKFYEAKHAQKLAFLTLPTIDEIFNNFNDSRLTYSLAKFPIEIELGGEGAPTEVITTDYRPKEQYDPRFLLPLFYHFMSADSIVKGHKFIAYGGLSYTIAALSSLCPRMRSVAYQTLARFYAHLDAANYPKERALWLGLIDHIRSGLVQPNQRLESVHTVYFVNVIEILHRPLSTVFATVRSHLLASQSEPYNYRSIPSLYTNCLNNVVTVGAANYARFQKFSLLAIYNSLRTDRDVRLLNHHRLFADVLTFFGSPLCAEECRPLIIKLLTKAAKLYEGLKILCFDYSIMAWVKEQLQSMLTVDDENDNKESVDTIKKALCRLVDTLLNTAVANHRQHRQGEPYVLYRGFVFEAIDLIGRITFDFDDDQMNQQYRIMVSEAMKMTDDRDLQQLVHFGFAVHAYRHAA